MNGMDKVQRKNISHCCCNTGVDKTRQNRYAYSSKGAESLCLHSTIKLWNSLNQDALKETVQISPKIY